MWSEIFLHESRGEKMAIILLDTQGVFDNKTSSKDCAVIFGLSTLLSSVQIYNLSENIQENDIQHLELFSAYGKLALEDTGFNPFQQLLFLIRDWNFSYRYEYGPVGGNRMITEYLQTFESQHEELKSVRKYLRECFSEIECFLMPHPGMNISDEHFDGKLEDISQDFITNIDTLVRMVLTPNRLTIKEVNGEKIRFKELIQFFRSYLETLTGDELPEPKNILDATAEVNNINIFSECKILYMNEMSRLCKENHTFSADEFKQNHEAIKEKILAQVFKSNLSLFYEIK